MDQKPLKIPSINTSNSSDMSLSYTKSSLSSYVTQSKKISKLSKENEMLYKKLESHDQLLLKHETMLKECLTLPTYNTKNQVFTNDIQTLVNVAVEDFNK